MVTAEEQLKYSDKFVIIDSAVTNRSISGKFSVNNEIIIHGHNLADQGYNINTQADFVALPGYITQYTFLSKLDTTYRALAFFTVNSMEAHWTRAGLQVPFKKSPRGFDFSNSLNVAFLGSSDLLDHSNLFIQVPDSTLDYKGRDALFCLLMCTLPNENLSELLQLITINPEGIEEFIKTTFAGIDQVTNRIPVQQLAIVDLTKYIPQTILTNNKVPGNLDFTLGEYAEQGKLDLSAIQVLKI